MSSPKLHSAPLKALYITFSHPNVLNVELYTTFKLHFCCYFSTEGLSESETTRCAFKYNIKNTRRSVSLNKRHLGLCQVVTQTHDPHRTLLRRGTVRNILQLQVWVVEHQTSSFIQERSHPVPGLHSHAASHLLWTQVPGVLRSTSCGHRKAGSEQTSGWFGSKMKLSFFSSVVSLCAFLLKVALMATLNPDGDFIIVGFFTVSPCLTEDVIVSVSHLMPCLIWTYYATMPLV